MPGGYCEAGKADFHGFCAGYFQQHCVGCCHFHHAARDFGAAMLLVIPIGTAIVLRQIKTQKGIRVELLETKAAMDGTVVEL